MAFERFKTLLNQRSDERPVIREALILQRINDIWMTKGVVVFPKTVQEHLKTNVKVVGFRKEIITIATNDVHSASAITLEKEKIRKLFEKHLQGITIQKIIIHQAENY